MSDLIKKRISTIRHEMSRTLGMKVPQFKVAKWLEKILNSDKCIYCNGIATTRDHLYSCVYNKKPREISNFSNFTLPCCKECNCSKGKLSWKVFIKKDKKYTKNLKILYKIDKIIKKNKILYNYDIELYTKYDIKMTKFLEKLNQEINNIKLVPQK